MGHAPEVVRTLVCPCMDLLLLEAMAGEVEVGAEAAGVARFRTSEAIAKLQQD